MLHVDVQVDDSSQNAESDGAELLVLFCLKIAALGCLVSSGPVQGNLMWSTEKIGMNQLVIIVSRSKMESEGS